MLIEPEFAGTENGHLEHLKRGGRITLEEEGDREGFRRPRQFHRRAGIPRQLDCFPEPHRPLAFEEILPAELENGTQLSLGPGRLPPPPAPERSRPQ